jgi:hypothetical protein
MVGKSYVDSGLIHWYLITHPNSMVLATAPSQTQLEEVLWKEVERAHRGARVPLGGRLLQSPLKVDLGSGWQALAYSTTKVERLSGHHEPDLFAVIDEASGVRDEIYEAIRGVNPSRELLTGNPLWPYGTFYDRCTAAPTNPLARLIQISSLESPHIGLARSPWGLADATWLEQSRNDYGEGSLWWTTHVLGLFPDSGVDTVVPRSWLELAGKTLHKRGGRTRCAIDLALGNAGDRSVVGIRDDNGILDWQSSNLWTLEVTATKAALLCQRWGVAPSDVSWDVGSIGADFANRLEAVGIRGARPYRGGDSGGKKFANKRSASAWRLRQRLDPNRMVILPGGASVPQVPFAIPPRILSVIIGEVQGLRYTQGSNGEITLELKDDFAKRLKHSPDHADTAAQLFGFPD